MPYNELETDKYTEIEDVSSFISAVKNLKEMSDGTSAEIYFRGQETEFWDIEPSIFRNGMLGIEHKLMQVPLQKIPIEFREFNTTFDIMTKYQHYGMCTRLLDLTTNPLVALYFACKQHGYEAYFTDEGAELHEPYGVVYYTQKYYPSLPTSREVQIVSALAKYDLTTENTVEDVLRKLKNDRIIDDVAKDKWLQEDGFREFANIIQRNYLVTPTYTNERLRMQSGVFLLASLFTISIDTDIAKSVISKSKDDLRKEFEKDFFYIRGENKEAILKELDLYNINEATLFPELEHQLSYIKHVNSGKVQAVAEFEKYEDGSNDEPEIIFRSLDDNNLNNYVIENLSDILKGFVESDDVDELKNIIQSEFVVDWYKRKPIISRMKMKISGYYYVKLKDNKKAKEKALKITESLIKAVAKYPTNDEKKDD